MKERWKYLVLEWRYEGEEVLPETHIWTQTYYIHRPGREKADEREAWSSADEDKTLKVRLVDLLDELGSEGWELIDAAVLDSVILSKRQGFSQVGVPIRRSWTFKKRAG